MLDNTEGKTIFLLRWEFQVPLYVKCQALSYVCYEYVSNRQKHVWGEISHLSAAQSQLCTH